MIRLVGLAPEQAPAQRLRAANDNEPPDPPPAAGQRIARFRPTSLLVSGVLTHMILAA